MSGTITGRSGSTDKLASRTTFKVQGDVSAADVQFDGQFTDTGETSLQKVFQTSIDHAFISNKTAVDVNTKYIQRTESVRKVLDYYFDKYVYK